MVKAPFRTALMPGPGRLQRPATTERPARRRAVGVPPVAGRAEGEEPAALATGALTERVVHGVGARRAGPDWTARRTRGTTAGTGSVCRSSRRSRGSRKALRALTPHLSPPRTLPERAAPRQRRGCGRRRSRGRKERAHRRCAKPRRRGFAQRPQLHCCCWYFNLNELNDEPEDRQVSRFAQSYATADSPGRSRAPEGRSARHPGIRRGPDAGARGNHGGTPVPGTGVRRSRQGVDHARGDGDGNRKPRAASRRDRHSGAARRGNLAAHRPTEPAREDRRRGLREVLLAAGPGAGCPDGTT